MKKLLIALFPILLFCGCATMAGNNSHDNQITQRIDKLEDEQKGLLNVISKVNADVTGIKTTQEFHAQKIGKLNSNSGLLSGGGPYLTIVAIVLAVLPPIVVVVLVWLVIKGKQGWKAFGMLREALDSASTKNPTIDAEKVIEEFKATAASPRVPAWLVKHHATSDLFNDNGSV